MGRRKGLDIDGVLLLDKPDGMSSNHALQKARRKLDARKAGHTGTLDPFATGLLVCCFGKTTKICGAMLNVDKSYRATLTLGRETDSGDLTGEVVQQALEFKGITEEQLATVLPRFVGEIEQIPPMYSALKRDGKPLYEYARQGIELEREARRVTIYDILVVSFTPTEVVLDVFCSKGTYIRTLAQDIGRALGCFAHLRALRRTSVGPFKLTEAISLADFQALESPQSVLLSLNDLPPDLLPEKLRQKETL
ncbi:tRNA pseudouridine(55) synthase TruB [Pelistega europaea]|uniref:tRNA pseudouridine synthase B n=1 Tax=Pelistega europaea TaxID=106147 RepID=A0A7Y4P474_9BURK|nr:tRNA pseudouridine(55) synthase TruB [Pelistega europaea]NOL49797.1 tRNA pseudouridine(55) synthase TruB [Pelistega europaea]